MRRALETLEAETARIDKEAAAKVKNKRARIEGLLGQLAAQIPSMLE